MKGERVGTDILPPRTARCPGTIASPECGKVSVRIRLTGLGRVNGLCSRHIVA